MPRMNAFPPAFTVVVSVAHAGRCAMGLAIFALLAAGAVAHAQIEVRVPAAGDAAEAYKDGTAARPVWLKVADVTGSYTIPYIQSSARLRVAPTFGSEQVVEAEVGLVAGDDGRGEVKTATKSGDVVEFTDVSPGEYTLEVTGRDAAGGVVSRDRHGPVAIGTVIAALGDSITEGYHSRGFRHDSLDLTPAMFPAEVVSRDRRNYPQFAPTTAHHRPDINCFTSWMPRLNDLLAEKWRQPVFIANEGWGGITTGRYLQMMKTDAAWQNRMRLLRPGVWLIHLGVNDGRAKLGADEVTRNLAAIVDILVKEYAATPSRIFVASPSYDYAPGAADRLAEYRTAIGKLVAEKGLKSGPDFFTAYATDRPRYYGTDPVHPNAEGMELMAKLWAEALPAALPAVPAKPPEEKAAGVNNTLLIFGDSIVAGGYGAAVVPLIDEGLVVAAMSRRIGHDYKGFPDGLHPGDEGKRRRSTHTTSETRSGSSCKPAAAAPPAHVERKPRRESFIGVSLPA